MSSRFLADLAVFCIKATVFMAVVWGCARLGDWVNPAWGAVAGGLGLFLVMIAGLVLATPVALLTLGSAMIGRFVVSLVSWTWRWLWPVPARPEPIAIEAPGPRRRVIWVSFLGGTAFILGAGMAGTALGFVLVSDLPWADGAPRAFAFGGGLTLAATILLMLSQDPPSEPVASSA